MNNLVKILLLLIVFLTPLIGAYKNFGYEHTKVLFFIVLISLIGLFLIREKLKWSLIAKTAGIFIIILLMTSLTGINPGISLLGTQPYFQGVILYAYLFLFFLAVSWSKIKFEHWAMVLAGSATLVGFLAIKDWALLNLFHQPIPTYAGRVVSTFGQPNFYAGFILLTLPFTYYLLANTKNKLNFWLFVGIIFLSTLSIIISQSRTSALFLIFLAFLYLITLVKKIWITVFLTFVTISALSIFLSNYFSSGILWGEIFGLRLSDDPDLTKESIEKRPYIWKVAADNFSKKPILGYGLENINRAYSNYFQENKHILFEENLKVSPVLLSLKDLNIDRTHNYLLDLLLFSGLFGLMMWILLVFLLIKTLINSKVDLQHSILLTGLVTYLIWIQFQNQSVVHLIYFWLLMGIIDRGGDN